MVSLSPLTNRVFSREKVELTIFRFRYLDNGIKVVELLRKHIQLKPYLSDVASVIDLDGLGNEFPDSPSPRFQRLSLIPVDESQLFGENYDEQFFPRDGSTYDVEVHYTIQREDIRIRKGFWSFELDVRALNGMLVTARFRRRLRKGNFTTVLKSEGMWRAYEGGKRGDLYVRLTVE